LPPKKIYMRVIYLLSFSLLILLFSCTNSNEQKKKVQQNSTPIVYTSNYPIYFFVQKIAGEGFDIRFPAKVSGDPAFWNPTAEDISEMQTADLIFLNGASYEKWLANVSLSQSKLTNTSRSFNDQLLRIHEKVAHNHGPEGEHEHSGTAFTTWLDLSFAQQQAAAIKNELVSRFPDQKTRFETNYKKLDAEIKILDDALVVISKKITSTKVIFSHPVYQYFENRYKISGISLHWEPDSEPDDAMWAELKDIVKNESIKYMIWEDQPLPSVEDSLNELGITCIIFNPCGNEPEKGDFFSVFSQNIENLEKIKG